ncbi:MAG: hypothetical protein KAU50_04480 [Candidatus Marinimicrobia bacterium]|nr:hypothetical protein [Candidatus Neomarinimicrobiota bacterium]
MKLEDQQVSQDLSRQLKDAGYPQEGLWWWSNYSSEDLKEYSLVGNEYKSKCGSFVAAYFIVAPTVAELGEALKDKDEYKYFLWGYHLPKRDCFDLILENSKRTEILCEIRATIEADARAKMWLYLKKEKLI